MSESDAAFEHAARALGALRSALASSILGQDSVIDQLLVGFFARGHILLEGLPGLGKTELVKRLADCLGLPVSRIQCTPDLLPADVTGAEVPVAGGGLEFRPGPLLASLVFVDEINRATPRTQAAFLEAMQEGQITCLGHRHALPQPNWIVATQNPIELEGTFPLPEAQLDRFTMKILVEFPDRTALLRIADRALESSRAPSAPTLTRAQTAAVLQEVEQIIVAEPLRRRAVDLLLALRPESATAHPLAAEHVRYGPSPRALRALLGCARSSALLAARPHVSLQDLRDVARAVLQHRILLKFESELDGVGTARVLDTVIGTVLQ
jgi:MoxR-like ATPase